MVALRIASIAALALSVVDIAVFARDVPSVDTSLLNVHMELYMAGIDKYVTGKSLTAVGTQFEPVKKTIRADLSTASPTIEGTLTPLLMFQYDVEKTQPGFKAVNGSQLTDEESSEIAVPKRWDAMYGVIKSLCDPLKNAGVTKALDKLDVSALAAIKTSMTANELSPPLETFLNDLTDLGLFDFGQTIVSNVTTTFDAFSPKFRAAKASVVAKLEAGGATPTAKSATTAPASTPNKTAPSSAAVETSMSLLLATLSAVVAANTAL